MSLFGTPSSILGALMIFISITMTPDWTMSQSLGALGGEGFGSVVFESGLLMAGSMTMIFAAALFEFTDGENFGRLGAGGILLFGLSTSALGISIIDLGGVRESIVLALLFIIPVSLALLSVNMYKQGLTIYAVLGAIATIISFVPWAIGGPTNTLQELMILLPFSVWQLVVGIHMYRLEVPDDL